MKKVKVNILHICSYYIGNKLYSELIDELDSSVNRQYIYIPVKNENSIGNNILEGNNNISFHFDNIINFTDKILYMKKIKKQYQRIENSLNINTINFIHAHTVFSDGGTAYLLKKKYGIKYLVHVRNTDVNVFYRYGIHLRRFMKNILKEAEYIVFLSPAYKENFLKLLPNAISTEIEGKCLIIPNGINQYWLNSSEKNQKKKGEKVSLLFIGALVKNKNVEMILKSCKILLEKEIDFKLEIIGDGPLRGKLEQLAKELAIDKKIYFNGYIEDRNHIINLMDESDIFIMPSLKETFGLVYIEAMSRGLPVIFSKGQGIDGYYAEGEIGFSVDPLSETSIFCAIQNIIGNYQSISKKCIMESQHFNWKSIKEEYVDIYAESKVNNDEYNYSKEGKLI